MYPPYKIVFARGIMIIYQLLNNDRKPLL